MKIKVTYKDYVGIKNSMTEEEIKAKFGYLKVMSEEEYEEEKKKTKNY